MECSNIRGESVENISQDGFNPSFQCNPSVGFKCNSKAPCHPCPLINVRLWCGCKKIRSPPSTSGLLPVTTAKMFINPVECYDYRDGGNWSFVTCEDACWRIGYFDFELGNVRNEYGCQSSYCDESYQIEDCYQPNGINSGRVCIQCCKYDKCNGKIFNEQQMRQISGISNSVLCNAFDLVTFSILFYFY